MILGGIMPKRRIAAVLFVMAAFVCLLACSTPVSYEHNGYRDATHDEASDEVNVLGTIVTARDPCVVLMYFDELTDTDTFIVLFRNGLFVHNETVDRIHDTLVTCLAGRMSNEHAMDIYAQVVSDASVIPSPRHVHISEQCPMLEVRMPDDFTRTYEWNGELGFVLHSDLTHEQQKAFIRFYWHTVGTLQAIALCATHPISPTTGEHVEALVSRGRRPQ